MAINVVSVRYNDGFLPDIILLTLCYYHGGIRLIGTKRFHGKSLERDESVTGEVVLCFTVGGWWPVVIGL